MANGVVVCTSQLLRCKSQFAMNAIMHACGNADLALLCWTFMDSSSCQPVTGYVCGGVAACIWQLCCFGRCLLCLL